MIAVVLFSLTLSLTILPTMCVKMFDLAGVFNNYTCLKSTGFQHGIIRAYHSYGAIDLDAPGNIRMSNAAGLSTDVYMFPCRGKNATLQVGELITFLDKIEKQWVNSRYEGRVGTIWLDIETNPSTGCSWTQGTAQSNCAYTKQLIHAIQSSGRSVGIYASAYMWNQIYGGKSVCTQFSTYPLWYAHYDGKQSFDDFKDNVFGGWTVPTIKQYAGDSVACGYKLDLSWF